MKRIAYIVIVVVMAAADALAGDCFPINDDRILGSDLSAVEPAFQGIDPGLVIGYAPAPGLNRVFTPQRLQALLQRSQLPAAPVQQICFERATQVLTKERILGALEDLLDEPGAQIEVVDFSRKPVPHGTLVFERSGLTAPGDRKPDTAVLWRGAVKYGDRRSMQVWARVRISVQRNEIVATRSLPAGQPITVGDVEMRNRRVFPSPVRGADNLDSVVGLVPRKSISEGQPIMESTLKTPPDVARGDTIEVTVTSGSAMIRFEAKAESGGRHGEEIVIKNPVSGRRFRATVEGPGQASLAVNESNGSTE